MSVENAGVPRTDLVDCAYSALPSGHPEHDPQHVVMRGAPSGIPQGGPQVLPRHPLCRGLQHHDGCPALARRHQCQEWQKGQDRRREGESAGFLLQYTLIALISTNFKYYLMLTEAQGCWTWLIAVCMQRHDAALVPGEWGIRGVWMMISPLQGLSDG